MLIAHWRNPNDEAYGNSAEICFASYLKKSFMYSLKTALRAVLSYDVHTRDLTQSEATSHMNDAEISDNAITETQQISSDLETINF